MYHTTEANDETVRWILAKLTDTFAEAIKSCPIEARNVDILMIAHNFHKRLIFDLKEENPVVGKVVAKMAMDTFNKSMEEYLDRL